MYDMLNVLTYVGIIFLTVIYNKYLTNIEVKTLIIVQLCIFLVTTSLQLINALRLNLQIGGNYKIFNGAGIYSDIVLNSFCFFFGI